MAPFTIKLASKNVVGDALYSSKWIYTVDGKFVGAGVVGAAVVGAAVVGAAVVGAAVVGAAVVGAAVVGAAVGENVGGGVGAFVGAAVVGAAVGAFVGAAVVGDGVGAVGAGATPDTLKVKSHPIVVDVVVAVKSQSVTLVTVTVILAKLL